MAALYPILTGLGGFLVGYYVAQTPLEIPPEEGVLVYKQIPETLKNKLINFDKSVLKKAPQKPASIELSELKLALEKRRRYINGY